MTTAYRVADFETTTDASDCRVWLWGSVNEDCSDFHHGTTIDEWIQHAGEIGGVHYFHNLAFDGAFILDWLLNNGWRVLDPSERFTVKNRKREIDTIIGIHGEHYQIVFTWPETKKRVTLRDSLKKLPFSVDTIAESFGLPESKGSIDYAADRPAGYQPTPAEIDYVRRDVMIVAQALMVQYGEGLRRMTIGADALADYKDLARWFDIWFPKLDYQIDDDIRHAYRGGYVFANPRYAGKVVDEPGSTYDVNSLYASVMADRLLPFGRPEFFTGEPEPTHDYPLWIAQIVVELAIKHEDGRDRLPCVQLRNTPGYAPTEYVFETHEPTTIYVTNIDWDLICEQYDVTVISWVNGWRFRGRAGMFTEYVDKWMRTKRTTVGGRQQIAKNMLNSLYGKFGTNPDATGRLPMLDERGIVSLEIGPRELRQPVYTAMAVFITSYARDVMVRTAQAQGDRFGYCDTDSLHIIGTDPPVGVTVDPGELGAWKHERDWTRAKWLRAKCYVEQLNDAGERVVKIAGLPASARDDITVDNLEYGRMFTGKLVPVRVKGGVVLRDQRFKIR